VLSSGSEVVSAVVCLEVTAVDLSVVTCVVPTVLSVVCGTV